MPLDEEEKLIDIRCSSLSGYGDCSLRAAVGMFWSDFKALGYNPRRLKMSAGAGVGNGTHGGIAYAMKQKLAGTDVNLNESVERGIYEFDEKVKEDSLDPDEVTPDKNSAYIQIGKLIRGYYQLLGYRAKPILIEMRRVMKIKDGYSFSGTLDQIVQEQTTALIDVKTGKTKQIHAEQLGGYSVLSKKYGTPLQTLSDVFLKRKPAAQDIDRPIQTFYMVDIAERLAIERIKQIKRDHQEFKRTQNPRVFPVNHRSFLCAENTCAAYGTPICDVWKIKEALKH